MVNYTGSVFWVICRRYIRVSKGIFQIFVIDGSMVNWHQTSFEVQFETVVNGLGDQNWYEKST